jgi:hypothetical protein
MNEMKKKLVDYINSLDTCEIVALHNDYCEAADYEDEHIFSMYDLDEIFACSKPRWILSRAFYGHFNPQNDYFWFDNSYNLQSADYIIDMPISVEDIADYILSSENALGNDEIQYMLDREINF